MKLLSEIKQIIVNISMTKKCSGQVRSGSYDYDVIRSRPAYPFS